MLEDLECPIERMQAQEPPASTGIFFLQEIEQNCPILSCSFHFWISNSDLVIFQMIFIPIDVVIFQFSILMRQTEF